MNYIYIEKINAANGKITFGFIEHIFKLELSRKST